MTARRLVVLCLLLCVVSCSLAGCGRMSGGPSQTAGLTSVEEREATEVRLATDWQDSDRSAAWFVWYADPAGENWMMFSIRGTAVASRDIGTRSFSQMSMGAD